MITAIVQFKLSTPVTCDQAKNSFLDIAPRFCNVPGLIRKNFLISDNGETAGGVYLWKSQEDAERFYTDDFKKSITERYGSQPSITYFESPVVVDNLIGQTITSD